MTEQNIDVLLKEKRTFKPSASFAKSTQTSLAPGFG